MPIAWCKAVTSRFAGSHDKVTSPQDPRGVGGGRTMRYMDLSSPSMYLGSAWTHSGRKWFHELIFLTAAGVASIVDSQSDGN